MPTISVLLPVYNGGVYLKSSVESVLNQEYKDFELLIVDDCSNDGSHGYLESLSDSRIIFYKNEINKGLFSNLNFLIQKSNSGIIKLWAQDDIMYPHCLGAFVKCHSINPNIGFSYSGRDIIDGNGKVVSVNPSDNTPAMISPDLHAAIAYYTGSIAGNIANACINKAALEKVGLFRTDYKISADFDMWVRLAKEHNTAFISDALIQLRDHAGQLSRNKNYLILHTKEDLEVYRNLDGYARPGIRQEGHELMKKHKLIFYYTLMIKACLGGRLKEGFAFYKLLSGYINFWQLTVNFLLLKTRFINPPNFDVAGWEIKPIKAD